MPKIVTEPRLYGVAIDMGHRGFLTLLPLYYGLRVRTMSNLKLTDSERFEDRKGFVCQVPTHSDSNH